MKKILILGGTQFVGRNLIEQLIKIDSYDITIFNRQQTQGKLFPQINKIKGDRDTDDIKQITKEKWDFIIDVSCYYPHWIENTIKYANSVSKYIFISTISVYDIHINDYSIKDENSQILSCNHKQRTDHSLQSYGNRKAECERILKKSGLNYLILRPALIYGKYDHTDRLYYWLYQTKTKKKVLLPENGATQLSLTYVKDLVNTILDALSNNNQNETYNIISSSRTSIKKIIELTNDIIGTKNEIINAPATFLVKNNISEWFDMPLWLNGKCYDFCNQKFIDNTKLKFIDFRKSIEQTIEYYDNLGWKKPVYGISEEKKEELLHKIIIANNA